MIGSRLSFAPDHSSGRKWSIHSSDDCSKISCSMCLISAVVMTANDGLLLEKLPKVRVLRNNQREGEFMIT